MTTPSRDARVEHAQMAELTRAQVEQLANVIAGGEGDGGASLQNWLDTDAALRARADEAEQTLMKAFAKIATLAAQLDQSMRRQEQLAKNVNDGLLEIRALKAQMPHALREGQAVSASPAAP